MIFEIQQFLLSGPKNVRNVIQMALKWHLFRNYRPIAGGISPRPLFVLRLSCISLHSTTPKVKQVF